MNSPPSSSDAESSSFHLLDPRIQRWIWERDWSQLKDAQERAIPRLISPAGDVVIAAATASGKTEAAFLPILTHLAHSGGLAMYVSPLKALINDQWGRLSELCERLEIAVTPWHGDISDARKKKFQKNPSGCLLITPESLEGMLIRNGYSLSRVFNRLEYVVVDELHAFLEDERGKQLQSLLNRLESALDRRVTRAGLSATLGNKQLAAQFLRPGGSAEVIESVESPQDLKVAVKGYRESRPDTGTQEHSESAAPPEHGLFAVAADLYRLRGNNNLIFPNSRRNVELVADLLRERCEAEGVANEFWPHHGSLSRELRQEAERALKAGDRPATAIATTTLELGIDIGAVKSVAQIGPAPSVASLRQRLGRSGRRAGEPAILRCYCIESDLTPDSSLSDQLRESLVQSTSQIRLLTRKWCEPPRHEDLHLSTLVQQLLALIAERSGVSAGTAWNTLCRSEVFAGVTPEEFSTLLRKLGSRDILQQESSGLLLLGTQGERIVNHYTFLAAFVGDEEFRVVTAGKTLGSLPISRPLSPGTYVILGGRRWRVLSCDATDKVIEVEPARSGQVPKFDGAGGQVHDEVRADMRNVLESGAPVEFLDETAQRLLDEARDTFRRLELSRQQVVTSGDEVRIFTWRGDRVNDTLALWLTRLGLRATNEGLSVGVFHSERGAVIDQLTNIAEGPALSATELAALAENRIVEKWDGLLPEALLNKGYGARMFEMEGTRELCREIVAEEP
jgi:ATP-dependent helicase Lhr and Lhr-like helicase